MARLSGCHLDVYDEGEKGMKIFLFGKSVKRCASNQGRKASKAKF